MKDMPRNWLVAKSQWEESIATAGTLPRIHQQDATAQFLVLTLQGFA